MSFFETAPGYDSTFEFAPDDKRKFAAALLREPENALGAAISVFGPGAENLGKSGYAAVFWPADREVIAEQQKLLADGGAKDFLPQREELARRVWGWTEKGPVEDRIKAAKLFAEIMDFIPKPGTNLNIGVTVSSVMEVPVSTSAEQWERDLAKHQEKLQADTIAVPTAVH